MLENIQAIAKRWKRKITPTIILVCSLIIYVGYVHVQLSLTQIKQEKIIYSIAKNIEYQNVQNVKIRAIEIRKKIDDYNETKNVIIDTGVIEFYEKAYALAIVGDKSCYIFEMLGDNIINMYALGFKDGKKLLTKDNHSF